MTKPEGYVHGLSTLGGCIAIRTNSTGILLTVPKDVFKHMGEINPGDMASWDGLWRRISSVEHDEKRDVVLITLA